MTLTIILEKKLKANRRLSVVKGMRLGMTIFLLRFLVRVFDLSGLFFLFLVFAIISEETIHAVVKKAMIANINSPSYSFSIPI